LDLNLPPPDSRLKFAAVRSLPESERSKTAEKILIPLVNKSPRRAKLRLYRAIF
jgi:hypothetical protein